MLLPLPQPEDVWFTMPVGEVDFSACTRCTPSYRALPAGYPRLACTERSQLERCARSRGWGGTAPSAPLLPFLPLPGSPSPTSSPASTPMPAPLLQLCPQ